MKKIILVVIFSLNYILVYSQTDYSRGFQSGYKAGYCYNDFGCVEPIPPVTPVPLIGENNNNYQDGYNRGFKMGSEGKNSKKSQNNYNNNNYNYQDRTQYYALLQQIVDNKQAELDKQREIDYQNTLGRIQQAKSLYSSLSNFPTSVKDGWHNVIATNGYDFCQERKVYVSNNKITKYVIDDWSNRVVDIANSIENGKSNLKLQNVDYYLDIFFFDYIFDQTSSTSTPKSSGKISFYTNFKRAGQVDIYLEGTFIGTLTSYFNEGEPNCGQSGTVTFEYKPGTYNYTASSDNYTWSGSITIYENNCRLHGLTK